MVVLELGRAEIAERGMESASIVTLVDEAGKISSHILEGFVVHQIDGLDLQCLHEALCLRIVVGVPAPPHRTNETVVGEQAAVDLRGILRAAVRVVNAALRWLSSSDGCLQRSNCQARIN